MTAQEWRALLKLYMAHVIACESISFLNQPSGTEMSPGQEATLRAIEAEIFEEEKP